MLDALGSDINWNVSKVNNGGCAVVAYLVAEQLHNLWLPVEVVTPGRNIDESPLIGVRHLRKSGERVNNSNVDDYTHVDRDHFVVRFIFKGKQYTWDTHGLNSGGKVMSSGVDFEDYFCMYPFGHGFTVPQTKKLALESYGWNRSFDRSQIPTIRKIVKKHFNKFVEQHV